MVVAEAIKAQLEKPTRACVNSESAFVAQRLRNSGYTGVAARYWSWGCGGINVDEFGEDVYNLRVELEKLTNNLLCPLGYLWHLKGVWCE